MGRLPAGLGSFALQLVKPGVFEKNRDCAHDGYGKSGSAVQESAFQYVSLQECGGRLAKKAEGGRRFSLLHIIAGRKALYDLWFPDQLGPANMLEFHLWVLAVHFSAMLAIGLVGLYEYARRWQTAHPESLAPPGG